MPSLHPTGPIPVSAIDATALTPTEAKGLSEDVARQRLEKDGANQLPTSSRHGLWAITIEVIREPMFILFVVVGTMYLVIGEVGDALLLLSFVFVVIGLTIVQERRTERALDALRDLSAPQAQVIRDGVRRRIDASGLVRGDLIVVGEGDRIPADAILRQAAALVVDESLLAGESVPVPKNAHPTATNPDRPGGDHTPSIFSGTLVTGGQGTAQVIAVGMASEIGRIGKALGGITVDRSPLQQETGRMVRILALVAVTLCVLVSVIYALTRGGDLVSWKQGVLAGITMAMATLPEELPMILTIFLALGAWRISRNRVLTRRMPAVETLGATTVLCTDKTGTLTMNRMSVSRIQLGEVTVGLDGPPPTESAKPATTNQTELLDLAQLACRSEPFDPMERAILAATTAHAPGFPQRHGDWKLEREYPLSPDLLAVTQAWQATGSDARLRLAAKGAPEAIADLCSLPPAARIILERQVTAFANQGLRVLGIAKGSLDRDRLPALQKDLDLLFVGLIGLSDPLRTNVPGAIEECRKAGVRVVMITGDYPATAQAIARQAGITDPEVFLSGPDLERMSDTELAEKIRTVQVFARVVPDQKLRIVQALKANREVVAMTGDGVNDAPALKAAHIGIAMGGRGTDVARESAALVLLDDDFAAIVVAIRLGRRIYDNIRKAVAFTFAVHVPIAGLSILPVFIPGWPLILLPVHVVFLELVIDPACTLIFEAEAAEPDIMDRPPRSISERLFSWQVSAPCVFQGASALVVCAGIFSIARSIHGDDAARALTFVTLVAAIIATIITNRSWSRSIISILRIPNPAQWWVILGAAGLLTVVLATPPALRLFRFAPLHPLDLAICLTAGVLCVGWFEILKRYRARPA